MPETRYEINPSSIGITETDGDKANWKDIWDYQVPLNTWIILQPKDLFAARLVGDDTVEMPAATRVRVVKRDVANEDSQPVLSEIYYQLAKDFTDLVKLMHLSIDRRKEVGPSEHIVVQVAGKDRLSLSPIHIVDDTVNTTTSADATTLATAITLANELKGDYNAHRIATAYHLVADATNAVTSANASNEATLVTLVNEIKADFNAHRTQTGVHPYNDNLNVVTSADATDTATAITLVNEEKVDYNAHLLAGEEGTGDTDASASYFKIMTTRRKAEL